MIPFSLRSLVVAWKVCLWHLLLRPGLHSNRSRWFGFDFTLDSWTKGSIDSGQTMLSAIQKGNPQRLSSSGFYSLSQRICIGGYQVLSQEACTNKQCRACFTSTRYTRLGFVRSINLLGWSPMQSWFTHRQLFLKFVSTPQQRHQSL